MKVYFNVAPKVKTIENTGQKFPLHSTVKKHSNVITSSNIIPESNLQWPDGFLYNATLLFNTKIW